MTEIVLKVITKLVLSLKSLLYRGFPHGFEKIQFFQTLVGSGHAGLGFFCIISKNVFEFQLKRSEVFVIFF